MPSYVPRNVLITGGAGFIGCHLVRYLLRTDPYVRIINLDALTYAGSVAHLQDLPEATRHTLVPGDICDRALVDQLLRQYAIDTIVHLAAESHVDRSITGPAPFIQTNVVGTFTLLEAARSFWLDEQARERDTCRFQQVSTDEVYGTLAAHEPGFRETTPYAPNSPYAASKAAADHLVRAYHRTYGLPTVTTHCSNNYGPYQHDEKLIPTVIRACLQSRSIPVYGDGSNQRDWLYVTDHCAALDLVLRRGRLGETYNIGAGNDQTNLALIQTLCQTLAALSDVPVETFSRLISFVPDRPGHDWRYAINAGRLQDELGWRPATAFAVGLRQTVAWYRTKYT